MTEELCWRRPHLLCSEEDAGDRTTLLVDHGGPSDPAPAPSHHAVDDAEIMSWLLPCPLALNHCFNDIAAGDGCHRGKSHLASLTINNAREDAAVLADCDGTVKLNKEAAEDYRMKKRKKKKRVSGEAGINRDGRMMMVNTSSSSSRDCLMVNSKDLLPPLDSGSAPITRQSPNQQVPNLDIIAALLPPPHGGGDEACVIAESSSSALSGRGSSSCMEEWGNLDAHCIIHANGQSLNQSLIKGGNPKVADNLDCLARFNTVSDPSRGSSSTTQKSVKEVDGSSRRKISKDDQSEGQSEASKDLSAQNVEEEGVDMERKKPSSRFSSAKRTRAAEVHNESERRRRDRINEKMRALQQIIPNSNKTDKASMLDEAIEYLKCLQAQVQYLSMNLGPLMMPMGMQYQHNLTLGMGIMDVGLGALNPMHYPQQHYLPGYHPIPPLSNAAEGLEHLQPQINCNGNGNVMNSYSYLIPHPHHLQWMQQARHPPSVQLNMQQHHMQAPMQQQLLPLPSLQRAKAQMNQSLGESTR